MAIKVPIRKEIIMILALQIWFGIFASTLALNWVAAEIIGAFEAETNMNPTPPRALRHKAA